MTGDDRLIEPEPVRRGREAMGQLVADFANSGRVWVVSFDQRDLARISGLSLPTIQRMEKIGVERSSVANAQRLQQALEAAGVEFIPENGGGAGVRLRKPGESP